MPISEMEMRANSFLLPKEKASLSTFGVIQGALGLIGMFGMDIEE